VRPSDRIFDAPSNRITDADIADESLRLTKAKILPQAGAPTSASELNIQACALGLLSEVR